MYDYVYPIYKTATQQVIYNQLVHPMETHEMGTIDNITGWVVSGDDLDEDYNRCILPPPMGDNPVGHCRSEGSHKRRAQYPGGAPNVGKLDIHAALVAIPEPMLMQDLKAMWCLWKSCWTGRSMLSKLAGEVSLDIQPQNSSYI